MNIQIASTDDEIMACFPVMAELRPHVDETEFLHRIQSQERAGYRLLFALNEGAVAAVAGFRIGENLAWGRFLYVDDLVTSEQQRSKSFGAALLSWLREHARQEGCEQLHLDSGLQRKDAHRFYEREGVLISSYHFTERLT